jgi:VWFA-related protein
MNRRSFLALVLSLSVFSAAFAQQQQQPQPAPHTTVSSPEDEDVVKITTNLVQVDAVVTDRSGKVVTDLAPSDFQIFEDGHPQSITNFSFVNTSAAPASTAVKAATAATTPKGGAANVPVPPARLRPEQVRRTIALVVDDLGLSFESMHFVRAGLRKFVAEQMQEGDLVAIIRTGGGVGALQQFTTDKQLLNAAIEHINWDLRGRSGFGAFAAIENDPLSNFANSRPMVSGGSGSGVSSQGLQNAMGNQTPERDARNKANDFKEEVFAVGTLGAINYVIRGLKDLPGRKSVVLVSDSLAIFSPQGDANDRVLEAMRRLTDLANRASVVIYTIDARGLPVNLFQAQDQPQGVVKLPDGTKVSGLSAPATAQNLTRRSQELIRSQDGLSYLAAQTGGFFVNNNNYLNDGLRIVMDDQKGFYLIGYRPGESTFDPRTGRQRFHDIAVRVTRPGLSVRTRTGFFGISDEEAKPVRSTAAEQLMAAITSPFGSGDVDLRLTSLFFNDAQSGSFMRSLIYVDARSLTFREQADGSRKANMDVVAVTFGADGMIVDQRSTPETIVVRAEQYQQMLKSGLIFGINLPIKKAGAYQLRVAVRDSASERVGSASQFIEVPRLEQNRLTLSGIYLASNEQATLLQDRRRAVPPPTLTNTGGGATFGELAPESGPAVRRFQAGTVIDYGFEVYNPRLDKATGRPQLQTQVRLFQAARQVYAGKMIPIIAAASYARRVAAIGHLQLGTNLAAGEYILQVIVVDKLAKEKQQVAEQWIDFEIK